MSEKRPKRQPDNWEKELGKYETKHSVTAWLEGNMDRYAYDEDKHVQAVDAEVEFGKLFAKVLGYGLTREQAQVVCLKVCFNWTLDDIAKELKMLHRQSVHVIWKQSLDILKKAGYKR